MLRHVALVRTEVWRNVMPPSSGWPESVNWEYISISLQCALLLVMANVASSPILVTLMMEALRSSVTSVLTRATQRNIPEDGILHIQWHLNLSFSHVVSWICLMISMVPEDFHVIYPLYIDPCIFHFHISIVHFSGPPTKTMNWGVAIYILLYRDFIY
jgi:hypothetical protein